MGLVDFPLRSAPDDIPVAWDRLRADDNGVSVVEPDGSASTVVGVTGS